MSLSTETKNDTGVVRQTGRKKDEKISQKEKKREAMRQKDSQT